MELPKAQKLQILALFQLKTSAKFFPFVVGAQGLVTWVKMV